MNDIQSNLFHGNWACGRSVLADSCVSLRFSTHYLPFSRAVRDSYRRESMPTDGDSLFEDAPEGIESVFITARSKDLVVECA